MITQAKEMPITVNQLIRSERKTLALIVKPDGSLIVRAPLRASEQSIWEFVEKNKSWIQKKQAEVLAILPVQPKEYVSGEHFMYLGCAYPLEIVAHQMKELVLEERFKLIQSAQANAHGVFERWYRAQGRRIITERVNFYSSQHGFHYKKLGITGARTRWGSCSADGSLNFSWRLILSPMDAVDYVVVHELVHTVFHNHSKRFWKKVASILPDYPARRKWLRLNGQQLLY